MRTRLASGIAAIVTIGSLTATPALAAQGAPPRDEGRQVSTYASLASPDYSGKVTVAEATQGLTLGMGTIDGIDGELVMVGGDVWRVSTDGVPQPVPGTTTTPFLQGTRFRAVRSGPVAPGMTCAQLGAAATELARTSSGMVAVRVRGTFTDLVTRSVPRQSRPYPSLADVVSQQVVFTLGQRRAVVVGFWTGTDMAGLNSPGLHLHALTADRSAGGHVLSCTAGPDVQISVQPLSAMRVISGDGS